MRRVLVTGATGLIGSALCERLLAAGDEVIGMARGSRGLGRAWPFTLRQHDVTRPFEIDVERIYHLACPATPRDIRRDPIGTLRTAIEGTVNVLEAARRCGARVLLASSSEVYGRGAPLPHVEGTLGSLDLAADEAAYAEAKRCAEVVAAAFARHHGVIVRTARIFNTYGPGIEGDDGRAVSSFVTRALVGETIVIHGAGDQLRSLCYVSDLVEGLLRLLALDRDPGPVNLGSPEGISVRDLAARILSLTGSRATLKTGEGGSLLHRIPDISRARECLGWEPTVGLEEGLARTIEHFRNEGHGIYRPS
jgi:UDP-glucuronate decarboxylase